MTRMRTAGPSHATARPRQGPPAGGAAGRRRGLTPGAASRHRPGAAGGQREGAADSGAPEVGVGGRRGSASCRRQHFLRVTSAGPGDPPGAGEAAAHRAGGGRRRRRLLRGAGCGQPPTYPHVWGRGRFRPGGRGGGAVC